MPPRARIIAYRNGSWVRGVLGGEVWKSCDSDNSLPVAARPQKATVIRQRPTKLRWSGCLRTTDHDHGRLQGHRDRLAREDRVAEIQAHHLVDPDQVLLVIRTVESQVTAELRELALADVPGLRPQRGQRVAGHDAHQPEHDQR